MSLILLQGAGVGFAILSLLFWFLLVALFVFVPLALSVYMVYWTYKDAKRRRMDSPEVWALVVVFGNLAGFIAYLLVRE